MDIIRAAVTLLKTTKKAIGEKLYNNLISSKGYYTEGFNIQDYKLKGALSNQ